MEMLDLFHPIQEDTPQQEAPDVWAVRKAERDAGLLDAIISRCKAEGVQSLDGVCAALEHCVAGPRLIAIAEDLIRRGLLTERDLIPWPNSMRPPGPNPYWLAEAARDILACLSGQGEIPSDLLKKLDENLKLFDADEAEFRRELDRYEGRAA